MNILWLLVGRGGSRGVPGKNLRRIGGRTLVEWKLGGAVAAGARREDIVVSSDSEEIRGVAMHYGAGREIVRPPELASDTATTADVVRHALETLGDPYDAVMLLEPSAPYTKAEQYTRALSVMAEQDADLVVGVRHAEPHVAFIGEQREDSSVTHIVMQFQRMARRRQDFRPCVTMSGALYLFRTDMFLRTGDIYGGARNLSIVQDRVSGHEIDTPYDLELAEWFYERGWVR